MSSVDPYELLANAIVEQAVKEYRELWHWKKDDYAKKELIDFFFSDWFSVLTKLNPKYLVEKLEEEANAQRQNYR